jgi:hypothetical protein
MGHNLVKYAATSALTTPVAAAAAAVAAYALAVLAHHDVLLHMGWTNKQPELTPRSLSYKSKRLKFGFCSTI